MEKEQIAHIRKHLSLLLKLTTVETVLVTELFSRNIFSQDEMNRMQLPHLTPADKASLFYTILMTRHNAFGSLKAALLETSNTGAFAILDQLQFCCREYVFPFRNVIVISKENVICRDETFFQLITGRFENRVVTVQRRVREKAITERIWGEVELLMKLDWHDNIIRYFRTEMNDGYILVALEFCKLNLEDWLAKPVEIDVNGVEILRQVLNGVEYLHNERTIHGNLNPRNILVTKPDRNVVRVKISDFALSSKVLGKESNNIYPTDFFPKGWSAPEVIVEFEENEGSTMRRDNTVLTSFAADIFSLGCIVHFVLTKGLHHPFETDAGTRNDNIKNGRRNKNLRSLRSNGHLRFAWIIGKMTAHADRERPSASVIKADQILWKSTAYTSHE